MSKINFRLVLFDLFLKFILRDRYIIGHIILIKFFNRFINF